MSEQNEQNVVIVKLVSGEEVIAMISPALENDADVVVEFPLITQLMQEGVGFMPFMPAAKTHSVVLKKTHILAGPLEAQPEMEQQYLTIVADILKDLEERGGVVLPEKKKFII